MTLSRLDDHTEVWRVDFPDTLLSRSWGDEVVVHDGATCNVHLLDAFSGAILDLLRDGPADVGTLAKRMREGFGLDEADLPALVKDVVLKLEKLELIERSRR